MPLAWMNLTAERRSARWFTNGLLTNPIANTVLAGTGSVPERAEYHLYIIGSSTVAALIDIEHRDSFGAHVEGPITVPVGANMPVELFIPVQLDRGHFVHVVNKSTITGSIAFSIALVKAYQSGSLANPVVENPDPGP